MNKTFLQAFALLSFIGFTTEVFAVENLQSKQIVFGHQSVGENILNGLDEISSNLKIQDHLIGSNQDPISKINDFPNYVTAKTDIAMMKFCYVDIPNQQFSPEHILDEYTKMVLALQGKYPNLKIVHFTVPLTHDTSPYVYTLVKGALKRVMGKSVENPNAIRMEYNNLLKKRFSSEPIFDLAMVESEGYTENNQYALQPRYTTDGGHLNMLGKIHVATTLTRFLADL